MFGVGPDRFDDQVHADDGYSFRESKEWLLGQDSNLEPFG